MYKSSGGQVKDTHSSKCILMRLLTDVCVVTCKYREVSRTGHGNKGWCHVRGFHPIYCHLVQVRCVHSPVIIPPEMAAVFNIYLLTYLNKFLHIVYNLLAQKVSGLQVQNKK